jgi:hypothetical protein
MSSTLDTAPAAARRDWRLRFSLVFTLVWLFLGFLYISSQVGWVSFVTQRAPELGGFLEGAFAPLAFLWLVVGFFLQQQQLEQNTRTIERQLEVMQRTAEQAEVQARAIAADEMHSRQDVFMRVAAMVNEQLGGIAGWILTSWMGDPEVGKMDGPNGGIELWRATGAGDFTAFNRRMIQAFYMNEVTAAELFWGTEIRSRHTRNFATNFERLLATAARCDPDGIISDALRDGSHGRIYKILIESKPAA